MKGKCTQVVSAILPVTPYIQARPFDAMFMWGPGAKLLDKGKARPKKVGPGECLYRF